MVSIVHTGELLLKQGINEGPRFLRGVIIPIWDMVNLRGSWDTQTGKQDEQKGKKMPCWSQDSQLRAYEVPPHSSKRVKAD